MEENDSKIENKTQKNINNSDTKTIKIIGKYSFGITLILLGITISLQAFLKIDILRYVLIFWPIVFIALGIEIIHFSRKNDSNIKYDFLSIFMIFVLIIFLQIFSVFDYGVNKVLYNKNIRNDIENNIEMQQYQRNFDADKKLKIINNSSKDINLKQVPIDKDSIQPYYIITCNYNQNFKDNIFNMYLSKNYLNKYMNYDTESQTLVIDDISKFADSLSLTIYTTNPNNVEIKNY